MEDIQFRTNKIKWKKFEDGSVCVSDAFALKDTKAYGTELAAMIATELIPQMINYADIDLLNHMLSEYEDEFEDEDVDPVKQIAPEGLTEGEINSARILYMKFKGVEWPDDERHISTESLIKAYFKSPDISKMPNDETESVFIDSPLR